jgi:hypothetical protein
MREEGVNPHLTAHFVVLYNLAHGVVKCAGSITIAASVMMIKK